MLHLLRFFLSFLWNLFFPSRRPCCSSLHKVYHNILFKIHLLHLLHLLHFFSAFPEFFTTFWQTLLQFVAQRTSKVPLKYICYICCAFFSAYLEIFKYHWINLVAVRHTKNHKIPFKIHLLHLFRFFSALPRNFFNLLKNLVSFRGRPCFSSLQKAPQYFPLKYICYTCCAFFQPSLEIFSTYWQILLQFVAQRTTIFPIKYICYSCCTFFSAFPGNFFNLLTNLVSVRCTKNHNIPFKVHLLQLLRFFF